MNERSENTASAPKDEERQMPEQRTLDFFSQDVKILTDTLKDRLIVSQTDGKMIRVDIPESWAAGQVGKRYTKSGKSLSLPDLPPGTLGVFPLPVRKMRQSLISAKSGEDSGACVRLVRASRYDKQLGDFVPMPREGDIANFFGFEDNQAFQLRFLDDSDVLYFNTGEDNGLRIESHGPSREQQEARSANVYLRGLIE